MVLFFFIALASLYIPASAQDSDQVPSVRTRIVKANTLSLFAGGMTVFYEQAFAPGKSFQLAVHSGSRKPLSLYSSYTFRSRSLAPEMRFYTGGAQAPQGFYLGPYLKYQHLRRTYSGRTYTNNSPENSTGLGAGATAGWQWVRREGFVMNVFFGLGYFLWQSSSSFDHGSDGTDRSDGRLGFSLGYAF